MAYTDALGEWEQVGAITATTEWQIYSGIIQGDPQTNREIFKLTYSCDWAKRVRRYASYGLIKFEFENGLPSGPYRIYPHPDGKMTDFPIPQELLDIAGVEYRASIRKVNKSRYEIPEWDPPWSLALDYFTGPPTSP